MQSKFTQTILGIIFYYTLLGTSQAAQAQQCTISDVAGKYGYTTSGTIVSPAVGPFTSVGHATLTESGTVSGAQTASIAGNLFDETLQGTFTVNPDCTGTVTVYVYHGSTLARTSKLNLVWDNHRQEVRGIFLTAGTSINFLGRRMFPDED